MKEIKIKNQKGMSVVSMAIIAIALIILVFVVLALVVLLIKGNIGTTEERQEEVNKTTITSSVPIENDNDNLLSQKVPDGTPYELEIKETREEKIDDQDVDFIDVNNFTLKIGGELKKVGYETNLTNENTVLNILSNDNFYTCKISCFSEEEPYILTEEQKGELNNLKEKATKSPDKNDINDFYSKYNLNRYTFLDGFDISDIKKAWSAIGINYEELKNPNYEENDFYRGTTYMETYTKSQSIEFYNQSNFKGIFLKTESGSIDDYNVEFSYN